MKDKIVPLREFCICGAKVINHHFFCDDCYSKRAIKKINHYWEDLSKTTKNNKRYKSMNFCLTFMFEQDIISKIDYKRIMFRLDNWKISQLSRDTKLK